MNPNRGRSLDSSEECRDRGVARPTVIIHSFMSRSDPIRADERADERVK
jgi:hypothetical protein